MCAFFLVYLGHLLQKHGELSLLMKESIDRSQWLLGKQLISLYLAFSSCWSSQTRRSVGDQKKSLES